MRSIDATPLSLGIMYQGVLKIVTLHVYCVATVVSGMATVCVEEYCREFCSFVGVLRGAPLTSIVTEIYLSIFIAMELLITAVHVNVAVSPTSY